MKIKIGIILLAAMYGMIFVFSIALSTTALSSKRILNSLPALATIIDSNPPSESFNLEIEELTTKGMRQFQFWAKFVDLIISFGLLVGSSLSSFLYSAFHTKKHNLSLQDAAIGGAISSGVASTTGIMLTAFFAYLMFFSKSFFVQNFDTPLFTFYPISPSMYGFLSLASNTVILRTAFVIFIRGLVVGSIIGLASFFLIFRHTPGKSNNYPPHNKQSLNERVSNVPPKQAIKLGLLILTVGLPIAQVVFLLIRMFTVVEALIQEKAFAETTSIMTTFSFIWFAATLIIIVFYVSHLYKNRRIMGNAKVLWAIALVMMNYFVMPFYWWKYIWQDGVQLIPENLHRGG